MTPIRPVEKKESIFSVKEEIELMKFLLTQLPENSRNSIKLLFKFNKIFVDHKTESSFNRMLKPGQKVSVQWGKDKMPVIAGNKLKIVFEDKDLIVIDKQSGLLTIATAKEVSETAYSILSQYVKKQLPSNKIFIVHRLDRGTSGLLLFAKNQDVQKKLQKDWHENVLERTYVVVVEGEVEENKKTITSWLRESKAFIVYSSQNPENGEKAITHYEVIKKNKKYSLLKAHLETGKKNQIRVHMQDIEHPVVGDKKYGSTVNPIKRLGLHAWVLAFKHPVTNKHMRFETEMPTTFLKLFNQ